MIDALFHPTMIFWPGLAAWTWFVAVTFRNVGREEGRQEVESMYSGEGGGAWLQGLKEIWDRDHPQRSS